MVAHLIDGDGNLYCIEGDEVGVQSFVDLAIAQGARLDDSAIRDSAIRDSAIRDLAENHLADSDSAENASKDESDLNRGGWPRSAC